MCNRATKVWPVTHFLRKVFYFSSSDAAAAVVVVDRAVVGVCFGGVDLAVLALVAVALAVVDVALGVVVVEVVEASVKRSSISADAETSSTKLLPTRGEPLYVAAAAVCTALFW